MNHLIRRRGLLIIISSPSGAGKTSTAKVLLENDPNLYMSVSATTRPPRINEQHGQDYLFLSEKEFLDHLGQGDFAEHAKVFGHYYGTLKKSVDNAIDNGKDVLFLIDWQGTQELAQSYSHDMVRIFLVPPTFEELKSRLVKRNTDSVDIIEKRLLTAIDEVCHWAEYDYILINNDFYQTVEAIQHIIKTERLRRLRQIDLINFIHCFREAGEEYAKKINKI